MKKLFFVLLAIAAFFCACENDNRAVLTQHEWQLAEMTGRTDIPRKAPTLQFADSSKLFGFAGCNRFFGKYTTEGANKLTLKPGGATMMFCPNMTFESAYLKELEKVAAYSYKGGRINMKDSLGNELFVFIPVDTTVKLDFFGCDTAAGYSWSEVRRDCIRWAEAGISLTSLEEEGKDIRIVFSADSTRVEVMGPEKHNRVILERRESAKGFVWNLEDDDTLNISQNNGRWQAEQRGKLRFVQP